MRSDVVFQKHFRTYTHTSRDHSQHFILFLKLNFSGKKKKFLVWKIVLIGIRHIICISVNRYKKSKKIMTHKSDRKSFVRNYCVSCELSSSSSTCFFCTISSFSLSLLHAIYAFGKLLKSSYIYLYILIHTI